MNRAVGVRLGSRVFLRMVNNTPHSDFDHSADWDALARYLAGESTLSEAAAVERWIAQDPHRRELLQALDRTISEAMPSALADVDVEAALARTHARMADAAVHPIGSRVSPVGRSNWRPALLRAAAVASAVVGAALIYSVAVDRGGIGGTRSALAYETATAERDSLLLPDGTRVLLGPETELTVSGSFGDRAREIALVGEAMFTVVHDPDRPFLVRVPTGVVQDLGTSFSVRTSADGGSRVVVTEGAVQLRQSNAPDGAGVVLREGDRGTLPLRGAPVAQPGAATADDIAWTRGVLAFRDAPMFEVRSELHRWFGFDLQLVGATFADRHLTATFRDDSAEQIASVIALALGGRSEVRGDTIVIHPMEQP
jgi:transmembrane sensor